MGWGREVSGSSNFEYVMTNQVCGASGANFVVRYLPPVPYKLSIGAGNLETDFPLNTIKGKICTQTIIEEFENHTKIIEFSIKPKVIMLTIGL